MAPTGDDVGMGNDEDEEPLEAEVPRARMNPKNPTSREKAKNMKIRDMQFIEVGVRLMSKKEELVDIELNCWRKKNEKEQLRLLLCLLFHDARKCRHVSDSDLSREQFRKGPTAYSTSFLVCFIKDLGFRRVILKCDNERSTKSLRDAMIQACAGIEVIPHGPLEGDHMANSRVEIAVREVKRQCRTLRKACALQATVRYSAGFFALHRK